MVRKVSELKRYASHICIDPITSTDYEMVFDEISRGSLVSLYNYNSTYVARGGSPL